MVAGSSALEKRATANEAEQLNALVGLSVRLGDVLHETQKERGTTAVYMSTSGAKFSAEMPVQKSATDVPLERLYEYLEAEKDGLPAPVAEALAPALEDLAELQDQREAAITLSSDPGATIEYYSVMNASFLDVIASVASVSSDAEIQVISAAYVAFLNAKERAGIERAQLSSAFGADEFAPGQFARVVSLIAAQDAYLSIFVDAARPEAVAFFDARQTDPAVIATKEFEDVAVSNGDSGFGVDSSVFFEAMTARINLLKEVEDFQSSAILARASDVRSAASRAFLISALLAVGMIVATLVVAWLVSRAIERPLKKLSRGAQQIASGEVNIEPMDFHSRDEIETTGKSFNEMLTMLSLMSAQAEAIAQGALDHEALQRTLPGEVGAFIFYNACKSELGR